MDALGQINQIQADEESRGDLSKGGRSILLHHGIKKDKAIIFLHGFTSAPQQFKQLGEVFFDQGFNVFIPRLPHHGKADTSTNSLRRFNMQVMVDFTNQVIDIAHGLGEKVTITGLSGAGNMAAWAGQNRADLTHAGVLAPMLGPGFLPAALTKPLAKLIQILPDFYMWLDPIRKAKNPFTEEYQYPGYSSRALSALLGLAFIVESQARENAPKANKVTMVSNANDLTVNNQIIEELVVSWESKSDKVKHHQFAKELGLAHDFITPTRKGFSGDIVYPIMLELFAN